jgi:hypothetical protein
MRRKPDARPASNFDTSLRQSDMPWFPRTAFALVLIFAGSLPGAFANLIYVDNLRGDDAADGTHPEAIDITSGPVRTIRRGLQLLHLGGTLNIANNNQPYYESMELVGGRLGGTPLRPTVIEGNGAELNGSFPVPMHAWRKVGDRLWKFTPLRKGNYRLILNNRSLPEVLVPPNSRELPEMPDGHWAGWKGSIYLQLSKLDEPKDLDLWYAVRSVGVTLHDVHDVVVRNLKVRHFRIDGVNAHDRAKNVLLENLTAEENGRAGVVSAGTSFVTMTKPVIKNNGRHSVLITEKAGVDFGEEAPQVSPAPTIAE